MTKFTKQQVANLIASIEQDEATIAQLRAEVAALRNNSWISVDDRMPKTLQRVLIAYTNSYGKPMVTIGWWCKAKTLESGMFEGEVNDEYDEATDTFYMKEQWVDESCESEYHYSIDSVTHWMPLPKMPAAMEASK